MKIENLRIMKVRDVITPSRGSNGSVGIDFYIPKDFKTLELKTNESVLIPSGIKCEIPKGWCLIAFNKSGVSLNKGLQVGACVVDEDYRGEIHIHLTNTGLKTQMLYADDKIIQFILIEAQYPQIELVDELWIDNKNTTRGEGAFGSTNKFKDNFRNKLLNTTAYLVKVSPTTESIRTIGSYSRHIFRDIKTQENYILDVSQFCPQFLGLKVGDLLTNLEIFTNTKTNNKHINGKSKPIKLGNWEQIKNKLKNETNRKVGFTL
jgi:dUTP pyrophosphatase